MKRFLCWAAALALALPLISVSYADQVSPPSGANILLSNLSPGVSSLGRLKTLSTAARYNNPRVNAVMASPPTVTISSSAPAYTKTYAWNASNANAINYFGGGLGTAAGQRAFPSTTISGSLVNGAWRVEAVVDSAKFTFQTYDVSTSATYRFIVDGQYVSVSASSAVGHAAANYITLDFTSAGGRKRRVVTLEAQFGNSYFQSIIVGATEGVYKPGGDVIRVLAQGDSITTGAGATIPFNGWNWYAGDLLGVRDNWSNAIGSTGLIANASGTQTTALQRISDVVAAAPDIMIIAEGYNDVGNGTPAQIQAALTAYLSALRAQVSASMPIFVLGIWPESTGPSAAVIAAENGLSAAVTAANDPLIFFIPVATDVNGAWTTGTGTDSATTGTGNADIYMNGSNTPHPNNPGHQFFGERVADRIMAILKPYLASNDNDPLLSGASSLGFAANDNAISQGDVRKRKDVWASAR